MFDFKVALLVFVFVTLMLGGILGIIYLLCTGHFIWAVLVTAGLAAVWAGLGT